MLHSQPLIAVKDVEASSIWYQNLLGCQSGHGGDIYEQLVYDGNIILQLHNWNTNEHPHMGDPHEKSVGNGVLIWFETDQFDQFLDNLENLDVVILEPSHINHLAKHRECCILDPDGYKVVIASPHGDVG
jgi:catechol 2,3-dioxygenase-like lactoylglutathione lyase family enzyme